jgi:hypothetical protein
VRSCVKKDSTIYFIYLGEKLPSYCHSSLELANKYSGMRVHLIGNKSFERTLNLGITQFTSIESFYDSSLFQKAKANLINNHSLRDGLWVKSLERFFVLYQFAAQKGIESIFHAELDQLLFGIEDLVRNLDSLDEKGIFVPFHSPEAAIASVFYCNHISTLEQFLEDAGSGGFFRNEMELIASWASKNTKSVHALPTMASVIQPAGQTTPLGVQLVKPERISGLVDAAQLGQWIAGIDPRNISPRKIPRTKFVDDPARHLLSHETLENIHFGVDFQEREITATYRNEQIRVYNLHLHSKIHVYLNKYSSRIEKILDLANQRKSHRIPRARIVQLNYHARLILNLVRRNPRKFYVEIGWRLNNLLGRRPSSYPLISGDTFRKNADHYWEKDNKGLLPEEVKEGDVIFCQAELFDELRKAVLEKLDCQTSLILGNSDFNQTKSDHANVDSLNIKKILVQNLVEPIPTFEPLPIGLENLWRFNHGNLSKRMIRAAASSPKDFRIMWGFSPHTNFELRSRASQSLTRTQTAVKVECKSGVDHQRALKKFAFVASPPGNGIDTHRTWEAMYLRCVPIVLRSEMTMRYWDIGLPIWVVDSYEELVDFTEIDLEEKYLELSNRFNSKAIWADFWLEYIKS